MKAMICTKYGSPDVLQLQDIKKPVPGNHEVLIKVHAASVTAADTMMRRGTPFYGRLFTGLLKPKNPITGTGFAGVVEHVGKDVQQLQTGDRVFGETGLGFGSNAEYVCVPEASVLAPLPAAMTFEEAAPVCDGALTSMNFLKIIGNIQPGQSVLINGAAGSLGTAAVQLAKCFGAEVTGVCSSANIQLVKSLGADHVIDYNKEGFTRSGQSYDMIYDTVGKLSFSQCKGALTEHGVYMSPVLGMPLLFQMLWTSMFDTKKARFSATGLLPVPELQQLIKELIYLIEAGGIKSVIDKRYALEQAAEAHRYIDTGHKKGNIVIAINATK